MKIKEKFTLPCGAVLSNRIAKAAMTERLAKAGKVNQLHQQLYQHWAGLDSGLLISGNIMVDKRYKEAAGNIVVENESGIEELRSLTEVVTRKNKHFWAQISHAGRQATIFSTLTPVAPSSVKLRKLGLFRKPRAMTLTEIEDVITRFVNAAKICQRAGFTGVQFHAAHGYLLNQFLSPLTNLRNDQYGGPIENRARLLLEIVHRSRKVVGKSFPISVKLNSADFQRGGFEEPDSIFVIKKLEELGIDLLEISGGTYENIVFLTKRLQKESTRQREAYFLDFAQKIRKQINIPLMVTGGFRSLHFCNEVLTNNELDFIGFARPYLNHKQFPNCLLDGEMHRIDDAKFQVWPKSLADMAEGAFYDYQIHRIAKQKTLKPKYSPYLALLRLTINEAFKGWLNL